MTAEINQIVDLYMGEEPKKRISLPEKEYGVCNICGTSLGKHDIGYAHAVCEQSMVLGNNELFY